MAHDLRDNVIIITGASSGIGAATAVECAAAGMDVVINARREDRLREVAEEVRKHGRRAVIVAGGVEEPGMAARLLDEAERVFGRFDAVFANAGYGVEFAVHEMSLEQVREMFEVNFFAGVDLLQQAAARLIQAGRSGSLLMCSSCLAKFSMPFAGPYCATKAAQNHMCRAMRIELAPHNINVASVHPIGTRTEFFEASLARSGKPNPNSGTFAGDDIPRVFMQPPRRVARAVVGCLRQPRAEVWTSFPVRFMAGVMTICPPLMDFVMRRAAKRR